MYLYRSSRLIELLSANLEATHPHTQTQTQAQTHSNIYAVAKLDENPIKPAIDVHCLVNKMTKCFIQCLMEAITSYSQSLYYDLDDLELY